MEKKTLGSTSTLLTLLILTLTLFGCLSGPSSNKTGISFNNATYNIEIWASTNCVNRGDTIHLRGTLSNTSSETRVFQAKDKPVFDIGVALGDVRVNWSDGKTVTPDLTRLEFKPLESKTLEMNWVVTGTALYGSAGAGFTFGDQPGDRAGVTVPINVRPACPNVIGP